MTSIPHRGLMPDSEMLEDDRDRSVFPADALPRLSVLLVGGGEIEAPLRSLARGEYEILAVPDAAAARRVLASRRVGVLCIGPAIEGVAARELASGVEDVPVPPPVRLVLAGGPDLSIFQEMIDESRLYYLSQAPPAPRELDALLRTAVRRAGCAGSAGDTEVPAAEAGRTLSGSVLVELLRRLSLLDDPEEIADVVANAARDLVRAERAYFLVFDLEKEELWARDISAGAGKGSGRRYESAAVGLVSFVLRSGLPVRVPRIGDDPRYDRSADDPLGRGDERFLAVPVTAAGHELGVLAAVREGGRPEFGDREEEDLERLAAQAAPSLAAQVLAERDGAIEALGGPDANLFRREVVEQTLRPKVQADPLRISPAWARGSYWVLVAALAGFLLYAWFGTIDEYASGVAVVETGGRADLTARTAGTVVGVEAAPGQRVEAGQLLVRFDDARERADLDRAEREFNLQLINRLRDPASSAAEQALIGLRAERELARARLEERLLRAPAAGVINDVLVRPGQYMQPGQTVLSLAAGSTEPTVTVVVPGQYRPLLRTGQPMRLEISGYRYAYQKLVVGSVSDEVIGPGEAQRALGPAIAQTVQVTGPVVVAKARLPSPTFEAEGKTYRYHNGMQGTAEIRVRSERLLWVLVPSLKAVFGEEHG
jgi:multidrug efflux pump subunit AcrA (membrane-fusion protein)